MTKQEKRNKQLTISFIALMAVIVALLFVRSSGQANKITVDTYRVDDLKAVDAVMLESSKEKIELRFEGHRWKVNGEFDADRNLIDVLFATLQQAEPKRPVAESMKDSVSNSLIANGVKVTLYHDSKIEKTFYAGGNEQKTQAYFMLPKGEPHIVVIPGYRVYVAGIFEVPHHGWREKLIFDFNWRNFASLEASYKNPLGNFSVEMQRNQVVIPGVDADTAKLNTYLDQVSLLTVDEFIEANKTTDSLAAQQPLLKLAVRDIANRNLTLEVFATDQELYGRVNSASWAVLSRNKIMPVLRPKEFFVRR